MTSLAPELQAAALAALVPGGQVSEENGQRTLTVPAASWVHAALGVRDTLGCSTFDMLCGVDEGDDGFAVVAALTGVAGDGLVLLRTVVPRDAARLETLTGVFAGADWHERETHDMFGVVFDGHPDLRPLLLADDDPRHPLRKDQVLTARTDTPWPGAHEPGKSPPPTVVP